MILSLALSSLRSRAVVATLTLVSIALSVFLLIAVEKVREGARASLVDTVSGTDLIVGAPSSDLALILYAVFHIGEPTAALPASVVDQLASQPAVRWAVPVALGDSHRGDRVVGTTAGYFEHIRTGRNVPLTFAAGRGFGAGNEVVLGADVAERHDYALGREIVLSHGVGAVDFSNRHAGDPFTVVGVLEATGTQIDRSLYVSLDALAGIHAGEPDTVTAVFLGTNSKRTALFMQQGLSRSAMPVTAVLPGVALARLWTVTGRVEEALLAISWLVVATACLGLAVAMLASLQGRRREMAVLRAVGAGPTDILSLLLLEAALVTFGGIVLGALLAYGAIWLGEGLLTARLGVPVGLTAPGARELGTVALVGAAGLLAALVPAWRAARITLADGLRAEG